MTEFERFACYVRNIGTATLSRYGAVLSNHINPAVITDDRSLFGFYQGDGELRAEGECNRNQQIQ